MSDFDDPLNKISQKKPLVFTKIEEVRKWRIAKFMENKSVGFIPTMGALHDGHLSLIKRSTLENESTIISIFVNPSQFSPTEDLDSYPRTVDKDIELILSLGNVDVVFVPSVSEIYPSGIPLDVSLQKGAFVSIEGPLGKVLEGEARPNFFRGVATIVSKFFIITKPNKAYFGKKDYQQFLIIKQMVKDLLFDIEIVGCEIYRDSTKNGIAMSSRNKYLSKESVLVASEIYKMLSDCKNNFGVKKITSVSTLRAEMLELIDRYVKSGDFRVDYIQFNDKESLAYFAEDIDPSKGALLSCAIYVRNKIGDPSSEYTRLIDNIEL